MRHYQENHVDAEAIATAILVHAMTGWPLTKVALVVHKLGPESIELLEKAAKFPRIFAATILEMAASD